MTDIRKAAQDYINWIDDDSGFDDGGALIQALRAALQQPTPDRPFVCDTCAEINVDADRYHVLRDGDFSLAVFADHTSPEPLRGAGLDAAVDQLIKGHYGNR